MKFQTQLNAYIQQLDCLAKDLSAASGISPATLSRYRSGERLPDPNAPAFGQLCQGIARLAAERGLTEVTEEAVRDAFLAAEDLSQADTELLMRNFDLLLSVLDISVSRLCRRLNYDPSTVFRFRSGSRRPAAPAQFADAVASSIAREQDTPQEVAVLASLLCCTPEALADVTVRYERLRDWLLNGQGMPEGKTDIAGFLNKLDTFDLNEYIRAIRFDQLKVPTAPFQLPVSKTYYGLKEMRAGELDFLKATVLGRSDRPVFMCSDMQMDDLAQDEDFKKKYMLGLALMLKKGLQLNVVHNLDRPFGELMLGLQGWVPLYMTGQISPYYLKGVQNNVYCHFLNVSGTAALSGECIAGAHERGRYELAKSGEALSYYQRRAEDLLKKALPLMDIYREDRASVLRDFLLADCQTPGPRRRMLAAPPLCALAADDLTPILEKNGLSEGERQRVLEYADAQRRRMLTILSHSPVTDFVPRLTREEFGRWPVSLPLSGLFPERDVVCSYEDYLLHLERTEQFARQQPGYTLRFWNGMFRNLSIAVHAGQWAMVSKGKSPAIHFVIRYTKLRDAIEGIFPEEE